MKLGNKGCLFIKDIEIWFLIFTNTNDILKKHPDFKLRKFDYKTKTVKEEPLLPNKIWYVVFDKYGRDYPSAVALSKSDFMKTLEKMPGIPGQIYNYNDYPNSSDLYNKMKKSGLDKSYTKKWFDKQYKFIDNQLKKI